MIERIHIEQLEIQARVGVTDDERRQPQRVQINITVWPERTELKEDDLGETIDYAEVAARARRFAEGNAHRLIETLAEKIADDLLGNFSARKTLVEIRKFVLPDTQFVSVSCLREKGGYSK